MKYHFFETTPLNLEHCGEFDCADHVAACSLLLASLRLRRYNKETRGETMGIMHMVDELGEIHWINITSPTTMAVEKLEPDDVGPLAWLIGPIVKASLENIQDENEEHEENIRDLEHQLDRARLKVDELIDLIQSARSEVGSAVRELDDATVPELSNLKEEIMRDIERVIEEALGNLDTEKITEAIDGVRDDLSSIESDLDDADGRIY